MRGPAMQHFHSKGVDSGLKAPSGCRALHAKASVSAKGGGRRNHEARCSFSLGERICALL